MHGLLEWLWKSAYWPSVSISFDDGYAELEEILPSLTERYAIRPLVFVPTAFMGRSNNWDYTRYIRPVNHLGRQAISDLSKLGVEFGSHGHSHTDLTTLSELNLKLEMRRSKDILEGILGQPVRSISYPFGRCSQAVIDAASEHGFERGYTMGFPSQDDQPLSTGRIAVYGYDTRYSVSKKLGLGVFRDLERLKGGITNHLSLGTVLLNRMRTHA
jgi:peptidoglycan/xylan/chitin deacetylase (PgdA/CDA1 family)